jgi:glycerophosphoryl diester phosphodiesterase
MGANAVEVDVRAGADGTPVVVHDATVDRVTDRVGAVSSFSADELAAMDVLESGVGVPTLATLLAVASERGLAVNVEVKEEDVAEAVVDAVRAAPLPATAVWVSSFDAEGLRAVTDACDHKDAPRLDTAYLTATRREDPVAIARDLACSAIHPAYDLVLAGDLVETAHAAGLDVNAWTLDSPRIARVVASRGVDGLIADVPLDVAELGRTPHAAST